jgi:ubiquinone biosynthesis protein COQ9
MNTAPSQRQVERDAVIMAALPHVPFDGWSDVCLKRAAADANLGEGAAVRLFPGGASDAVRHFMGMADRLMLADLEARDLGGLKIRERIATAVRMRLERWQPHKEAVRRAIGLVPVPTVTGPALRGWYHTVDLIWRMVGDRATDFSFYTKRMLLAGVYGATLLYWLDDRSPGSTATWEFLGRRIDDVMRLGKLRASVSDRLKGLPKPSALRRRFADRMTRGFTGVRKS